MLLVGKLESKGGTDNGGKESLRLRIHLTFSDRSHSPTLQALPSTVCLRYRWTLNRCCLSLLLLFFLFHGMFWMCPHLVQGRDGVGGNTRWSPCARCTVDVGRRATSGEFALDKGKVPEEEEAQAIARRCLLFRVGSRLES